ncbi:hypothetical protein Plec18167_006164 [Paecilomyces lecythidis]|uniref:Uncharacterized protein n=1 Tax=Paecilomyces lecythidis TaxID=3004212 RepID=A0ABR3XCG4_9EURO
MSLSHRPRPLTVFEGLQETHPKTLVLKEKVLSLTGNSFHVRSTDGQPVLRVKGKTMSFSGRRSVYDMANRHLFDICKKHLHIRTTFAAETPQARKLLEVKSGFSLIGCKATATITTSSGQSRILTLKGNWLDRAEIVEKDSGAVMARIERKFLNENEILFGKQTYTVTVAPGVDIAVIAAICICFDDKNKAN